MSYQDQMELQIGLDKLFFTQEKNQLSANDSHVNELFRSKCKPERGNVNERDAQELKRLFISKLLKDLKTPRCERDIKIIEKIERDKHKREVKVTYFEKKIGLYGDVPPTDYSTLKDEVMKWTRIGMQKEEDNLGYGFLAPKPKIYTKTGFKKLH